jgi:ATP synthase assembly factor FMC1
MKFTLGPSVTTAIFSPQHFRSGLLQHPISKPTVAPQLRIIPNQFAHNKTNKMAQTPTPQIRSIYRRLLRELPSTPQTTRTQHQKLSSPSKLQQRIRQTLSRPSPTGNAQSQIAQAEQFIQYVQAQRTHSTLLERYNPGMGMTEEERVRLSARRVGINLPVEYQEEK